jgi:hypothetical protein
VRKSSLTAVTETGTPADVIWARQAMDALLALKEAGAGSNPIDPCTAPKFVAASDLRVIESFTRLCGTR